MREFGCAVRDARRMSQAICISSRCGLSAQAATKAPAVERLMPAKQCITIGVARSHAPTKSIQPLDMFVGGRGVAIHRRGDVIDRKHKMIFRCDMGWPLHTIYKPQQGDDMACTGLVDRCVQARK